MPANSRLREIITYRLNSLIPLLDSIILFETNIVKMIVEPPRIVCITIGVRVASEA